MKNWGKKCIMVLLALVITLGSLTTLASCKKKSTAPAETPRRAPEMPE